MYVCNTGVDCEDCIGKCEQNLEWEDEVLEWDYNASDVEREEN